MPGGKVHRVAQKRYYSPLKILDGGQHPGLPADRSRHPYGPRRWVAGGGVAEFSGASAGLDQPGYITLALGTLAYQ